MVSSYEAIRPLLFGDVTLSQRSDETHIPSSTLSDYARRFLEHGMDGLRDRRTLPTSGTDHPFPAEVAAHIIYLKQVYPPMAYREIVRILQRKFGYHTNHHTVKRFLDRHAPPVQLAGEAERRRRRAARGHAEGVEAQPAGKAGVRMV